MYDILSKYIPDESVCYLSDKIGCDKYVADANNDRIQLTKRDMIQWMMRSEDFKIPINCVMPVNLLWIW